MKVRVDQQTLSAALQTVSRAVSTRSTIPALAGILVEASPDGLFLKAYDNELGIHYPLAAEVEGGFSIVLPSRILGDIVRSIPGGNIDISIDTSTYTAEVKWGKSEFSIHGFDPAQFPDLPTPTGRNRFAVPSDTLRKMIRQTSFAIAQSDVRPILSGVMMEKNGRELSMAAVDGVRLAYRRFFLGSEEYQGSTSGEDIKAVVPGRALNEIARIAAEASETCFEIGSGQVFFDVGRIRIVSRLLEGQFPPYRQIVPSSFVTTARVQTSVLHDAVERASLISADDDYAVRLRLSSEGIGVLSASSKVGRAQEAVEAQVEGEEMEIAFNARFLIDGLRAVDAQEVLFRTTGRFGPACIRPLEHENFIYVVMPLKTP